MNKKSMNLKGLVSWAFYDWANSAFSAIIQTFVFAAYFTQQIADNEVTGAAQWGFVNGLCGLIIAISAPILGAIADFGKSRKLWLLFFTLMCIVATALLWFIIPEEKNVSLALILVSIGIIGSELATVFYNAMLPFLAPENYIGRWSGWGWSFGYAGGLASLIIALLAITETRAIFLLAAVWYFLFSFPLFLFTPDSPGKDLPFFDAVREGLKQLRKTLSHLKQYRNIIRFLIAHMLYIDGLTTLFAFGGVYAAVIFGMNTKEILLFGILLHITAGIGAALFAWFDDLFGAKPLILLSLVALIVTSSSILLVTSSTLFWVAGGSLGIFVGPLQSASRSFFSRIVPVHLRNEMFGFYALSGKSTSFLGPLLVGILIFYSGFYRVGMGCVVLFFILGFALMTTVSED